METHRVRRLRWQARAGSPAEAFALRQRLREQGEACQAALQRAFDAMDRPGQVWHLPRLELTLRLDGDLDAQLEQALKSALAAAHRPADDRAASGAGQHQDAALSEQQALQQYLQTGLLPWTLAGLASEQAQHSLGAAAARAAEAVLAGRMSLEQLLLGPGGEATALFGALLRWLPLLPLAQRRELLRQARPSRLPSVPAELIQAWLAWMLTEDQAALEWPALWLLCSTDQRLPVASIVALATRSDARTAGKLPFLPPLLAALQREQSRTTDQSAEPSPAGSASARPDPAGSPSPVEQSLLVPLAGLVLLHPWLPRLLAACGLLEPGGRQLAAGQLPRACALLHGLAWGAEVEAAEHQLPLIKLLLGGPPDAPLSASLPPLNETERAEIEALLDAVRQHWTALRGTAVEGLRLSFLQRRGLLSKGDGCWRLRMQDEAFDLLLARLPWSIALVRLPWMSEPLMVEWQAPS